MVAHQTGGVKILSGDRDGGVPVLGVAGCRINPDKLDDDVVIAVCVLRGYSKV
jgi:hypothetical protein